MRPLTLEHRLLRTLRSLDALPHMIFCSGGITQLELLPVPAAPKHR
jgi:hypothetical protein